jgi:hypothetical protein
MKQRTVYDPSASIVNTEHNEEGKGAAPRDRNVSHYGQIVGKAAVRSMYGFAGKEEFGVR